MLFRRRSLHLENTTELVHHLESAALASGKGSSGSNRMWTAAATADVATIADSDHQTPGQAPARGQADADASTGVSMRTTKT